MVSRTQIPCKATAGVKCIDFENDVGFVLMR